MSGPDPVSWLVIEAGWSVVAADGSEVGTVRETVGDTELDIFDGLVISTRLLAKPRYVPAEVVGAIVEGSVQLALSPGEVERLEPYERRS